MKKCLYKERTKRRAVMVFAKEADFEKALIERLFNYGWENKVLKQYTPEQLLKNWADILFENNRSINRLNNYPLTEGEMQQILEQINTLKTPLRLNTFINGKSVAIKRDNPDDKEHFGKEVSLKIYDRNEIAAGQSRYQIAEQPTFPTAHPLANNRRGDLMLLINGMPVIHIELKKSGIDVSQACNQIEKYADEGVFTGIFSLIQVFVAMNPEETVYFSNPGPDGKFNPDYYFHWADSDNEHINDWQSIAEKLLSIPMAHQLIGFYTVADDTDGILKVMRSYQYYAASAISDKVAKAHWHEGNQLGGYIWHTTGSGKTMTSFKAAQLIANSEDADKVVFLMDRIELGIQSLRQYRGFANPTDDVQETENTGVLITKLKSDDTANTLIVTSIQKMSNIKAENNGRNKHDIELMQKKRIVFIVDECHRDTFGDMMIAIKDTFPDAIFFGFTGTPILAENQRKLNTTSSVFGNELHRYIIADGIRDKNVLAFDPCLAMTYKERDLRKAVALQQANAATEEEAIKDPDKKNIYYYYMNTAEMAGEKELNGKYIKGIEDFLPNTQYTRDEHQDAVVSDIIDNWVTLSQAGKFHALFATSSIPEAIIYYRKIKKANPDLHITALFDPNVDNTGGQAFKEDGLLEIIKDYNELFGQSYNAATYQQMKKDISARLAHKKPYERLEPKNQLNLLIVVDQMLTGFDSKWLNTLYLDKMLRYENIIQAFSRTNRIFGPDKPFGIVKYYRFPFTMKRDIERAFALYSGDKPRVLYVSKLEENLVKINILYKEIETVFLDAGIVYFAHNPKDPEACWKFASLFGKLSDLLEAAKIQGFRWDKGKYKFKHAQGKTDTEVVMSFDHNTYLMLLQRYKELFKSGGGVPIPDPPFPIKSYLTEINTGVIDAEYMNSRFTKYLHLLHMTGTDQTVIDKALEEVHKTFAILSQEEQKYAQLFLHDVERGDVKVEEGKSLRDYINEYQARAKDDQLHKFASAIGVDEKRLRKFMKTYDSSQKLNMNGRFEELRQTVNKATARQYFEQRDKKPYLPFEVNMMVSGELEKFISSDGFDI